MSVAKAALDHLVGVRALLHDARYRYLDLGNEDLPNLLARMPCAVGDEYGRLWGFFGVQLEERPATLPPGAPTRAYVRALLVGRQMRPSQVLQQLLPVVDAQLAAHPDPVQMLCYGGDSWLALALAEVGFIEVEQVQFYSLDRLARRVAVLDPVPADVELSPAHPNHLDDLAQLDAATFPPLWHFGGKDLFELLMRCRVQLAWWQGRLAGYSALCANNRSEGQLARLAVHPAMQGQGIGRALLSDAIVHAAGEFATLVLNTQTTNTRAQMLYRRFGFHAIGVPIPVLARPVIL